MLGSSPDFIGVIFSYSPNFRQKSYTFQRSHPLFVYVFIMAQSFCSSVVLPANWRRQNPQPCWYQMKVPQFIKNTCVVCYQSKQKCELQFKSELTLDAFHKIPFPVYDSESFNPMFGYYPVSIPEHHWFYQWNEFCDIKFVYYEKQQEAGVSPPSE